MFQINPYRYNCEILKKFFANPIILIISFLFFVSAITSVTVGCFFTGTILSLFPVVELQSAIGFLFFYIKGRKKAEIFSFSQPINTLTIASIVSIAVNTLALIVIALIFIFEYSFNLSENILSYYVLDDAIDLLMFYAPICFMNLLSSISLLVLLNSIKKSSKSIYLYKSGSIFFAFTSFVYAVILICLNVYEGILITSIGSAVNIIVLIMLGVFSIMYNRYITNGSSNVFIPQSKTERLKHPSEPTSVSYNHEASTYDTSLVNMWTTPVQSVEPPKQGASSSFVPQPAFGQAGSESEPQTFTFCSSCGSKCMPDTLFCGKCGTKLTN